MQCNFAAAEAGSRLDKPLHWGKESWHRNKIRGHQPISPVLQYRRGLMRHAVDAPVRVPVLVADGDGEAAVVGADHLDGLAFCRVARDEHLFALALVRGLVPAAVRRGVACG